MSDEEIGEKVPLLASTNDFNSRSIKCGELSIGTAEVADSNTNISNEIKGKECLNENETFYQNPQNEQVYSGDPNNSSSDCSDSLFKNEGF